MDRVWDQFDLDDNGDLDVEEFATALERANVGLKNEDISKLFNFMDTDDSGYVDRSDWIIFMLQRFKSPLLCAYQRKIMIQVKYDHAHV